MINCRSPCGAAANQNELFLTNISRLNSRDNLFRRAFAASGILRVELSDTIKGPSLTILGCLVPTCVIPRRIVSAGQLTISGRNYFPLSISYLAWVICRYCKFRCRARGNSWDVAGHEDKPPNSSPPRLQFIRIRNYAHWQFRWIAE